MTINPEAGAIEEREAQTRRRTWITPDLIFSEIASVTEKLSSTSEFYVPEFHRTLGPS